MRKRKKPVVLFVDDAHDLNRNTLIALKRLIELVEGGGAKLSVVLAGHSRLRNELRETMMEEIGYRTAIYSIEGVTGSQREDMTWLIDTCAIDGVGIDDVLEPAAVDLLAARLRTPLQIEQHLILPPKPGFRRMRNLSPKRLLIPSCRNRSTASRRRSIATPTRPRC